MACVHHNPYCDKERRCIACLMAKPKPDPAMDRAVERTVAVIRDAFKKEHI